VRQNREFENELMKNVPGWKTGTWYGEPVYFTMGEKWWDPKPCGKQTLRHVRRYRMQSSRNAISPDFSEFFAHVSKDRMKDEVIFEQHSEYAGPHWWDKYFPTINWNIFW
jgi:NADH dehydrogenase (ubiquinone) 1 alpha subcomplex subunit 13